MAEQQFFDKSLDAGDGEVVINLDAGDASPRLPQKNHPHDCDCAECAFLYMLLPQETIDLEEDEWNNKRLRTLQYVNETALYLEQVSLRRELTETAMKLAKKFMREEIAVREKFGFFKNQEKVNKSKGVGLAISDVTIKAKYPVDKSVSVGGGENSTLKMATNFEPPESLSIIDVPEKYFTFLDRLAISDDTLTIETLYPCRICPLVFVYENRNLDRPEGLLLDCMYCDQVFESDSAYLRDVHMMLFHKYDKIPSVSCRPCRLEFDCLHDKESHKCCINATI